MAGKRKRGAGPAPGPNGHKKAKNEPVKVPVTKLEKRPFVETPTGEERKREASLYDFLGSEDETERIAAADRIISSLLGPEPVPEPVLERHLDRRLFRGLASGRNASRLGFSLVITELLNQLFGKQDKAAAHYSGLTFEKALRILMDKTQPVGSIPGQEERDHYLGQLFGIECFVRSQVVFAATSRWTLVLDLLLKIAQKKIWLRSQCGWVIVQAIQQMDERTAEATLQHIADANLAKTADGVAIWITALNRFPSLKVKPWRHPLATKTLGDLVAVLKENTNDKDASEKGRGGAAKQANWTAQLHFVWDIILSYYSDEAVKADEFEQFWQRVVDDGAFSKNATDGQKFKGFMIFQKMLDGLVEHKSKVDKLFSKNFMSCLMNQAAKEDRYLHRAATKALKAMENTISAHPKALVPVLKNLLGMNGAYNFDQRTSTKTVDKLLQASNGVNEKKVLEILRGPLSSLESESETQARSILRTYVEYLSKALNSSASANSDKSNDTKDKEGSFGLYLQELSKLAYSQPKEIPAFALTEQIRELCRSRLESSLAKLSKRADDYSAFCDAVAAIDSSSVAMDDDIRTAVADAVKRMQKLLKRKSKSEADRSLAQALAMLHAISIFQLYNEDPDAMETLNDLAEYDDKLKKGGFGDTATGSSGLLVEILLSMVARPSTLMRQVSQQVFDAFSSQITSEGLQLLLEPLVSSESTKGQQELFNTEDDAMEVDEGDSDNDEEAGDDNVVDLDDASDFEIGSDVEFVNLESKSDDEEASDEDSDDVSESDSEDEDEDESAEKPSKAEGEWDSPEQLDDMLGAILKSHRLDKDADAASSASEGEMSDSQMLAMDDKVAEVLKQLKSRSSSKKDKKDAKQSVVNFKHRILDLLDIYARNEAHSPLAYSLLLPLLQLMHTTSTKPLASRACEIILSYQKGVKKARANKTTSAAVASEEGEEEEETELLPLLVAVHDAAGQDNSHAYAKAASAASLIVASSMFAEDKEAIKHVAAVYGQTQSKWVLGEVKLQTSFFADWNNWCQNHASQARSS
ncbi:DNA-directed DNA polymerase [Lecanicillium sp. MT-2017a]|nr:DNA-directed DNA polymerase [Lecanicillium sp. MT-2017a]